MLIEEFIVLGVIALMWIFVAAAPLISVYQHLLWFLFFGTSGGFLMLLAPAYCKVKIKEIGFKARVFKILWLSASFSGLYLLALYSLMIAWYEFGQI